MGTPATPPPPQSPPPPQPPPGGQTPQPVNALLSLDAAGVLQLINDQAQRDRASFDRLLKWFIGGTTAAIAVFGAIFAFLNWQTREQVANDIRQETRKQLKTVVDEELTPEKVDRQIERALRAKTDAQFQDAISKAVQAELNTPSQQGFFKMEIKRQVEALTSVGLSKLTETETFDSHSSSDRVKFVPFTKDEEKTKGRSGFNVDHQTEESANTSKACELFASFIPLLLAM